MLDLKRGWAGIFKDAVRIVYARPATFQIQHGGCVIRVCFWPQVMAKLTRKERGQLTTHIKFYVNLEAFVTITSGFDM